MSGTVLGALALALVVGALALWMHWIQRVQVAGRRRYAYAIIAAGAVSAVAALASEPGTPGVAMAGLALAGALIWAVLGALARQSQQQPAIAVGDPLPAFTAPDHDDRPFDIETLRGHPVLIKLFRGHW